jgi:hypothetical protein
MAKKKPKRRFSATKAVKALARQRIGAPPATKLVPDATKQRKQKHRPTLGKLLKDLD